MGSSKKCGGRNAWRRVSRWGRANREIRGLRFRTTRGVLSFVPSNRVEPTRIIAMQYILIVLQLTVALGILNVWLLRSGKATPFRGGDAKTLREEFAAYGLPFWFMVVVGVLKVGLALALLAALWLHALARPAAIGLGLLMLGAFVVHLKVKDPIKKALPSLAVLAMCAAIVLL